jgi:hypothetical protein
MAGPMTNAEIENHHGEHGKADRWGPPGAEGASQPQQEGHGRSQAEDPEQRRAARAGNECRAGEQPDVVQHVRRQPDDGTDAGDRCIPQRA